MNRLISLVPFNNKSLGINGLRIVWMYVKLDFSVEVNFKCVLAFLPLNNLVQELRAAVASIEPKHEKEIDELIKNYKNKYQEWVIELRFCSFVVPVCNEDSVTL